MSSTMVLSELSSHMTELWDNIPSNSDKQRIQQEYIKIFSDVWRESVTKFNKDLVRQDTIQTADHDQQEELHAVTPENMEEVEIRHEATLITVTKKRKEYPSRIAAYLGKSRRLQKNAVETLKVDLPPRTPLDVDDKCSSHMEEDDDNVRSLEINPSIALSESMQHLQPHIHRLNNLADALSTLTNIHDDPQEYFSSSKSL